MKYDTEVKVIPVKRPFANTFMTHERGKATLIGSYAMDLCRVGMALGYEHSKTKRLHLIPPQQVAQRACSIAEALFAEMDSRGWLKELPTIADLQGEDNDRMGF